MLCSKENSDERPLSRTTLDLLKQTLGMQKKTSQVFRLEFQRGPVEHFLSQFSTLVACVGFL